MKPFPYWVIFKK